MNPNICTCVHVCIYLYANIRTKVYRLKLDKCMHTRYFGAWHDYHFARQKVPLNDKIQNTDKITYLAVGAKIFLCACTLVFVQLIIASSTVAAWIAGTFVDIYRKRSHVKLHVKHIVMLNI